MIIVTSLREAHNQLEAHGARRAISILSPETPHPVFTVLQPEDHLRLTFHDVITTDSGLSAPSARDAERLVAFIDGWQKQSPMLIHCWAGISRSTAAAFVTLCMNRPREDEDALALELRDASPSATPNRLIVSQADALLGRKGRMLRAVERIGRGSDAFEGRPFTLAVR